MFSNLFKNMGIVNFGRETLTGLKASGLVNLDGTEIQGSTVISGNAEVKNAKLIGAVEITGNLNADNTNFSNKVLITGYLSATACVFTSGIVIMSNQVRLSNSKTKDILIKYSDSSTLPQEVYISDNSEINGDIKFESGSGKVFLAEGSVIHGEVIGGTLNSFPRNDLNI